MTSLDALLAAENGERYLDAHGPANWRGKINLRRLNMEDPDDCILGQLYGSYIMGLIDLGRSMDFEWACEHGFDADRRSISARVDEPSPVQPFHDLTEAWTKVLS